MAVDLTSKWNADDGGVYAIRQIGPTEVVWYGEPAGNPASPTWSNVAHGTYDSQTQNITLKWADVPVGTNRSSGNLVLHVDAMGNPGGGKISKVSGSGGSFGARTWTR